MLMEWKTILKRKQCDLQIQCNLYQNSNCLFYKNRQVDLKIYMEFQGTLNSQNILEKVKQSWRLTLSDFKTSTKLHNKNSVVLA